MPAPSLQVFREDGLLSGSPNFGLDWFEGAIAKPDLVLADFYSAFHPTVSVQPPPKPASPALTLLSEAWCALTSAFESFTECQKF